MKKRVQLLCKKNKKWRSGPFHKSLIPLLKELIKERKKRALLNYCRVDNMSRAFSRYLVKLGIVNKGYSMRTFRKTFIPNANMGMDLATVSKLVGHSQINTTAKYYTKVDTKRQKKQLDKLEEIESAE